MANGDSTGDFDDLWHKLPDPPAKTGATDTVPLLGSRRALREQGSAARGRVGVRPPDSPESGLGALASQRAQARPGAEAPAGSEASVTVPAAPVTVTQSRPAAPTTTAARAVISPSDAFLSDLMVPEQQTVPARSHGKGPLVWLLILALVAVGLFFGLRLVWTTLGAPLASFFGIGQDANADDYEDGIAEGEAIVTIPDGVGWSVASSAFHSAGVTKTASALEDYILANEPGAILQPGEFRFQQKMSAAAAYQSLMDQINAAGNVFTVYPAQTQSQIFNRLSDFYTIPVDEFRAVAADPGALGVVTPPNAPADTAWLEGWLAPGDYEFADDATAQSIVQTMVDRQKENLAAAGVPQERDLEILTIASIISREGYADTSDYGIISRIIQNRLEWNPATVGLLQMDSTAKYGTGTLADNTLGLPEWVRNDPNPWNTFVHQGLPVGPIGNPGPAAINAAMNPPDGSYLFFVHVNPDTGEIKTAETFEEHKVNVDEFLKWCSENPDYGC